MPETRKPPVGARPGTLAIPVDAPDPIIRVVSYDQQTIEEMPSIARQVRDVIRIDPRVSIGRQDNGAGSGINCLGGAPRSNSITIDGAVASDGFGLNEGTGTSARFGRRTRRACRRSSCTSRYGGTGGSTWA